MFEPKVEVNSDELSLQDLHQYCDILETKVGARLTYTLGNFLYLKR